tara:strand:- start:262 stop:732 length:471 start_codon:yes stop_codon:yes gene_type:complete
MPVSFTVTTLGLQSATLEMDGGTKPGTTGHYLIKRKPNGTPFAIYLVIYKTTEATVYDHPRSQNTAGVVISWDYVAYSYITATSSYDSGIAVMGPSIQPVTDAQIISSGVAEPTSSVGTISNTYLAQTETKPTGSTNLDENTWTVTKVIPLAVSSQ